MSEVESGLESRVGCGIDAVRILALDSRPSTLDSYSSFGCLTRYVRRGGRERYQQAEDHAEEHDRPGQAHAGAASGATTSAASWRRIRKIEH